MESDFIICRLIRDLPFLYIGNGVPPILNSTKEDIMRQTQGGFINLIHPDDRRPFTRIVNHLKDLQSESFTGRLRLNGKNSPSLSMILQKSPEPYGSPTLLFSFSSEKDISTPTPDKLPCAVSRISAKAPYRLQYASPLFYQLFGFIPSSQNGNQTPEKPASLKQLIYPEDFEGVEQKVNALLASPHIDAVTELEYRIIHPYGRILWMMTCCRVDPDHRDTLLCTTTDITKRRISGEQLEISEEQHRLAASQTEKTVSIYDISTKTLILPEKTAKNLGLPVILHDVPDSILDKGLLNAESLSNYMQFYSSILKGLPENKAMFQFKSGDGEYRWFKTRSSTVFDQDGLPLRAVITHEDITQLHEKELAYQHWMHFMHQQRSECISYYEYNLTRDLIEEAGGEIKEQLPGYLPQKFSDIISFCCEHIISSADKQTYASIFNRNNLLSRYHDGKTVIQLEHRRKRLDHSEIWALSEIQMLPDPFTNTIKAFVLIKNIDPEKREALKLQALTESDPLTGLYNRRAVESKIRDLLTRENNKEPESRRNHALIMLDVDNFKQVNDHFGHQFGDRVLKTTSLRLKRILRKSDLIGRLGGDEFIMILNDISSITDIHGKLEIICATLYDAIEPGIRISGSLGLAFYPEHGTTFEDLYFKADMALYDAKRAGRNQYSIYSEEIEEKLPEDFRMETEEP